MKQNESMVIRTLTEAMMNARSLNESEMEAAIRTRILSLLNTPEAPKQPSVVEEGATYVNEEAVANAGVGYAPSANDQIRDYLEGKCPCCVVFEAITSNSELPLGDETFLYELGVGAGYEVLSSTMLSVAERIEKGIEDGSLDPVKFALRYGRFTNDSGVVRNKLEAEGLAPKRDPMTRLVNSILHGALANKLASQ